MQRVVHRRRFSSPTLRAWSIRFSKSLFMHMVDNRLLLSMRVGNVRSKTILNPTAKMLLAMEIDKSECDDDGDGQPLCLVVRAPPNSIHPYLLNSTHCPCSPHTFQYTDALPQSQHRSRVRFGLALESCELL